MLLSAAKSSSDGEACVLNTSSIGYELFDGIHFVSLLYSSEGQDKDAAEKARKKQGMSNLYKGRKAWNVSFARELAKRRGDQDLHSGHFV